MAAPGGGAAPREIDAVVFDYGGVLTTPLGDALTAWQEADGIDPASFTLMLKEWLSPNGQRDTPVHRLETGRLSADEFDLLLAARLSTIDGRGINPAGLLSRMFAAMRPDPAMFTLATDLRALGVRVALLSNSWGNTYPRDRLDPLFDPVVISGEVGLRKPLPPIYELTCERLGLAAPRVIFVDDAETNVEGARAVGMAGLLHTDPVATRAAIAELVPGLAAFEPGLAAFEPGLGPAARASEPGPAARASEPGPAARASGPGLPARASGPGLPARASEPGLRGAS